MVRAGRSGCNRRGAEAGLVREHAAGNAPAHGRQHGSDDGTADAARDGLRRECHGEHLLDARRHSIKIHNDDDDRGNEVEHSHRRHDDARHEADAADAADEDAEGQHHDDGADRPRRDAIARIQRCRNRVGLRHIADAKRSEHGEQGEQHGQQAAEAVVDAVLHGVHRAAGHLADAVRLTILDSEHGLAIFRRQAERRRNPHPDERARAAEHHSRRDPDDIARADRRRQRRHQRLERRDVARVLVAL